ncbi:MAG: hypothetical protein AB7Q29_07900 [Vicinamibacterales bacterium]
MTRSTSEGRTRDDVTQRRQAALVLAAIAVVFVALSAGLRPDAFYVGDPGVKLLAAHHAAAHPAHPLQVALPTIGSDRVPHVSPFFIVHDDHAHAVTSELFPLLTAPLLATLGLRGLYLWPAFGFLLALAACARLGRALDPRRSAPVLIATAAAGTPLLFYGLEFWEHAPAVAAATAAAALFVKEEGRTGLAHAGTSGLAGALFGLAVLLRPEAAWFALAVCAASRLLPVPPPLTSIAAAGAGALLVVAPFELHDFLHFGSLVPGHLSANAALLEHGWAASRGTLAARWLLPPSFLSPPHGGSSDLWRVGPAAIAALISPAWAAERTGHRFLWTVAILDVLLVLLTAPNDGGGQWGPRYLLFAYVPLALLASDVIDRGIQPKALAGARPDWVDKPRVRRTAIALLLLAALWVQRAGYRELKGAKSTYGRIADFVAETAPPESTVVTDVWWLDQVAAAPLRNRNVLFAATDDDARGILSRMADHGVPQAIVIRSREDGRSTASWTDGVCYSEERRDGLSTRSLVALRLRLDCPEQPQTR